MEQREIKYQGHSKDTEEVFQFDMWIPWEAVDSKGNTWYTKKMKIVQYVGLKDMKGKDIYEGDVLRLDNDRFLIEIVYSGGRFEGVWIKDELKRLSPHMNRNWLQWEVIGNVYKNPELLK